MFVRYVLPVLAAIGLGFAIYAVVLGQQTPPVSQPVVPPPQHPEFAAIAGAGIIESRMENLFLGTQVSGIVRELFVKVGDKVVSGDPLFRLDDRVVQAAVRIRQAQLAAAAAELQRLVAAPRLEDLPPAEAAVTAAEAREQDARLAFDRAGRLRQQNAVTTSELDQARFAYDVARAELERARTELVRLRSGTWEPEIAMARAAVEEARSQLEATQVDLELLITRAPTEGEVLQVNIRPGEFAAQTWREPLIVLGDVSQLHVRVDIDEQDVPFYRVGARAIATLKGRPGVRFDLEFVKVEPFVIPKRSLTGDNAERVDTRVLQVIYALGEARPMPLYVGQQMDVYLEATLPPEGLSFSTENGQADLFHSPGALGPDATAPTNAAGSPAR